MKGKGANSILIRLCSTAEVLAPRILSTDMPVLLFQRKTEGSPLSGMQLTQAQKEAILNANKQKDMLQVRISW